MQYQWTYCIEVLMLESMQLCNRKAVNSGMPRLYQRGFDSLSRALINSINTIMNRYQLQLIGLVFGVISVALLCMLIFAPTLESFYALAISEALTLSVAMTAVFLLGRYEDR